MSITIPFPDLPDPPPPGNNPEVEINRINTKLFIDADPVSLIMTPQTSSKVVGGGRKYVDGAPRTVKVYRMIPQGDAMPEVQTPDGIQLVPSYVLMGEWNATMERWDKFTVNGIKYMIVSPIRPHHTVENRYFTKADVARV